MRTMLTFRVQVHVDWDDEDELAYQRLIENTREGLEVFGPTVLEDAVDLGDAG